MKISKEKIGQAVKIANEISSAEALKSLPEFDKVETHNEYEIDTAELKDIKVTLINIERGKNIDQIEAYIKYHPNLKDSDVIFLNELDYGMLRTGNINVTGELSKRLGMNYIYGIEFMELTLGDVRRDIPKEKEHEGNKEALHGNAILSKFKMYDSYTLRLPAKYDWYVEDAQRLGNRMALFTKIEYKGKEIGLVCTHLENRASGEERALQMKAVLDEADKVFKDIPVIISGDMNTNTYDGTDAAEAARVMGLFETETDRIEAPEKYEPLLGLSEEYGYNYKDANVKGKLTRRKPIEGKSDLLMNLDWFFVKGLECFNPKVTEMIFDNAELEGAPMMDASQGMEITDHDAITLQCRIGEHTDEKI